MCSSTAYGSLDSITELNLVAELEDPRYINPARFPNTVINAAAGYVSIWEDLRAPNATIVDGNCGALDAVLSCRNAPCAQAARMRSWSGGGDVLTEPLYLALRRLGAIATGDDAKWAPGERDSKGLHLGEERGLLDASSAPSRRGGPRSDACAAKLAGLRYERLTRRPPREGNLLHAVGFERGKSALCKCAFARCGG